MCLHLIGTIFRNTFRVVSNVRRNAFKSNKSDMSNVSGYFAANKPDVKSRDMTSYRLLFWRAFVPPAIFGIFVFQAFKD